MPAFKPTGSQFDGILARRKPLAALEAVSEPQTERATGKRALAKSKSPEFRPATLYLRKKTMMECEYRLRSSDDVRDMSELVEDLMRAWLAHSAV